MEFQQEKLDKMLHEQNSDLKESRDERSKLKERYYAEAKKRKIKHEMWQQTESTRDESKVIRHLYDYSY